MQPYELANSIRLKLCNWTFQRSSSVNASKGWIYRLRGGKRSEGGKTEERAQSPCRGSFQPPSGPRWSFARDAGNWAESLALPASAYVIDSAPVPRATVQLPPSTFPATLSPDTSGVWISLFPSTTPRVALVLVAGTKALAATVGTWQGSIIMATAPCSRRIFTS